MSRELPNRAWERIATSGFQSYAPIVLAAATFWVPLSAEGVCVDGQIVNCTAPGIVCGGKKECNGGIWGPCECVNGGTATSTCTVCGGSGTKICDVSCGSWGACTRPEVCVPRAS